MYVLRDKNTNLYYCYNWIHERIWTPKFVFSRKYSSKVGAEKHKEILNRKGGEMELIEVSEREYNNLPVDFWRGGEENKEFIDKCIIKIV